MILKELVPTQNSISFRPNGISADIPTCVLPYQLAHMSRITVILHSNLIYGYHSLPLGPPFL